MKRMLHSFVAVVILCSDAKPATITWDGGGGDGIWSTAANWVGDVIPLAGDDVVLDNSVVAGTYIVSLPAGSISVSVNSLTITPAGVNVITFRVPITNASITAFTATGSGDAVVLNNGAIFINSSGAGSGTPVSVTGSNFFRINNGGKYDTIHPEDILLIWFRVYQKQPELNMAFSNLIYRTLAQQSPCQAERLVH